MEEVCTKNMDNVTCCSLRIKLRLKVGVTCCRFHTFLVGLVLKIPKLWETFVVARNDDDIGGGAAAARANARDAMRPSYMASSSRAATK
jgi:hypothetical protein